MFKLPAFLSLFHDLTDYRHQKRSVMRGPAFAAQPEDCPERSDVQGRGDSQTATCARLASWVGNAERRWTAVRRDACQACVRRQVAPGKPMNSVIASHLYRTTSQILQQDGIPGCDVQKANQLQELAEKHLAWLVSPQPLVHPRNERGHSGQMPGQESVNEPALCQAISPPSARGGPSVQRWAVGVTTAPRTKNTLATCLDSLVSAGWTQPWLFVDGGTELESRHAHLPVTYREHAVGAWANYYLALVELLMRFPDVDAYLLVQDDAYFYDRQNVREYMESVLWPEPQTEVVSLYCPSAYSCRDAGWHHFEQRWVWGAVAMIFRPSAARSWVSDPEVLQHRWKGQFPFAQIDVVLGRWVEQQGRQVAFPVPSLVQHLGETSTIWSHGTLTPLRRADRFMGDRSHGPSPANRSLPAECTSVAKNENRIAYPSTIRPTHASWDEVALITTHWNPHRFTRLRETYYEWLPTLAANVLAMEWVLDGEPELVGSHVVRGGPEHLMWQKERLINCAIELLPDQVQYVAWLDHDLCFTNPHWLQQSIALLHDGLDAVQPFSHVHYLNRHGRPQFSRCGAAYAWRQLQSLDGSPGGAWVARRDFLRRTGGVYDREIAGAGDAIWFAGLTNLSTQVTAWSTPHAQTHQRKWQERIGAAHWGFVDGTVCHLWHGDRQNRQYSTRHEITRRYGFDPNRDVIVDANGLLRWTEFASEAFRKEIADYFLNRRDDG